MTAATLVSIAVTPARPVDRQGRDPAVHGDRDVQRQLDAEPDEPGDVGVGDARSRRFASTGLASGVWRGTTAITATLGSVTSNGTLTVTAATLVVDRGDAGDPIDREGRDAAVHGDRDVQRQHDAEPDQPGDVDLGDAVVATIASRAWPRREARAREDHGDAERRDQSERIR